MVLLADPLIACNGTVLYRKGSQKYSFSYMKKKILNYMSEKSPKRKKMGIGEKIGRRIAESPRDVLYRATEDGYLGYPEEALLGYDEYMDLFPMKTAHVLMLKGFTYALMEDNERALEFYDKAIEKNRKDSWIFTYKGLLLEDMERWADAARAHNEALSVRRDGFLQKFKRRPDPEESEILGSIAHCYSHSLNEDDKKLAEKYMEKSLALDPNDDGALHAKAHMLQDRKAWGELLQVCERALEDDEIDFDFLEWKAMAHLELNQLEDAYDSIRNCITVSPEEGTAWYNLACYYALKGEKQNCIDKLTVAIHLDGVGTTDSMIDDEKIRQLLGGEEISRLIAIDEI